MPEAPRLTIPTSHQLCIKESYRNHETSDPGVVGTPIFVVEPCLPEPMVRSVMWWAGHGSVMICPSCDALCGVEALRKAISERDGLHLEDKQWSASREQEIWNEIWNSPGRYSKSLSAGGQARRGFGYSPIRL